MGLGAKNRLVTNQFFSYDGKTPVGPLRDHTLVTVKIQRELHSIFYKLMAKKLSGYPFQPFHHSEHNCHRDDTNCHKY